MKITEKGNYKLLEEFKTSSSGAIATLPAGTIINITQVDERGHQIIGDELLDWEYWELPVGKITD